MRILLLLTISWIIGLTEPLITLAGHPFSWRDVILIGGGLFLLWKATTEIHESLEGEETQAIRGAAARPRSARSSCRSSCSTSSSRSTRVLTAVGMVDEVALMIAAVVIAVGVMLFASGPLAKFVHEHPSVKILALSFLLLIGVTLIADGFGFHIDKAYIYAAMAFSVFVEALNLRRRQQEQAPGGAATDVRQGRARAGRPPRPPAGVSGRVRRAASRSPTSGGTHSRGVRLGIRPEVAVVVGATGRDQPELARDGADRVDGRRRSKRAVVDLQAAPARPRPARAGLEPDPAPRGSGRGPGSRRRPRWPRWPPPARAPRAAT